MNIFDVLREKLNKEKSSNPSLMEQAAYWRNGIDTSIQIVNQVEKDFGNPTLCYLCGPCEYQNEDIRVDDNNGWIPVSERLPEEFGWYLVTILGDVESTVLYFDTYDNEWTNYDCIVIDNVIAWQPLPETYKGE